MMTTVRVQRLGLVVVLGGMLLGAGCGPKKPRYTMSAADIAGLAPTELAGVEAAGTDLAEAQKRLAEAKKRLHVAKRDLKIAEESITQSKAGLSIAQMEYKAAQESKDAEQLIPAKSAAAIAEAQLALSKAQAVHRSLALDFAKAALEDADAQVYSARCRIELAKFEAVTRTRPELQENAAHEKRRAQFTKQAGDAEVAWSRAKDTAANAQRDAENVKQKVIEAEGTLAAIKAEQGAPRTAAPDDAAVISPEGGAVEGEGQSLQPGDPQDS